MRLICIHICSVIHVYLCCYKLCFFWSKALLVFFILVVLLCMCCFLVFVLLIFCFVLAMNISLLGTIDSFACVFFLCVCFIYNLDLYRVHDQILFNNNTFTVVCARTKYGSLWWHTVSITENSICAWAS